MASADLDIPLTRLASAGLRPHPLGRLPTPIEATQLAPPEAGCLRVWREDLADPLYGGNKVRKLRWLLPAAKARGGELLSGGGVGSHWLLACALHGAPLGVRVHAVLIPQPETPHVLENLGLLQERAGVLVQAGSMPGLAVAAPKALWAVRRETGRWPMIVGPGGSNPLGTVGWVEAAFELAARVKAGELPAPDALFVAAGSGGTAAGLWLGLQAAGLPTRLHAVRVADAIFVNRASLGWLAKATRRLLARHGWALPAPKAEGLVLHTDALGPGYGHATPEGLAAIEQAAGAGLALEQTYTGKALGVCLRLMRAGELGREVLFLNSVSAVVPTPRRP